MDSEVAVEVVVFVEGVPQGVVDEEVVVLGVVDEVVVLGEGEDHRRVLCKMFSVCFNSFAWMIT